MAQSLSILFARGARRVTGSNFIITAVDGSSTTRIMIDCGLAQGEKFCESVNNESFQYDPASIDALFFTHAHADHIGLFPKLVLNGFRGEVYATAPTRDLIPIMLEDSAGLMGREGERCNTEPPYKPEDVAPAAAHVKSIGYHERISVGPFTVEFLNAGHIVGSALVVIEALGKRIVFTGDLGRTPAILVPDREVPQSIDVLVTESVYGNRVHSAAKASHALLQDEVRRTAQSAGILLIPAFSLERTQIILAALDGMIEDGSVPQLPVFMDSPLAAQVTEVYRAHPSYLRNEVRTALESGNDPFSFKSLTVTANAEASRAIESVPPPKVIIAGAGMSHGGRIRHHEAAYLGNPAATLLLVGYQVPGSLGRRLKDGAKKVEIDGKVVRVRARIVSVDGYSAHADRDDLMAFAEAVRPKRTFVVLGESDAASFLAQRISGFLSIPVDVPVEGSEYEIL